MSETNTQESLLVTSRIFDLSTFEEVEVGKLLDFTPVASIEEALEELDVELLKVINKGLLEIAKAKARKETSGWHTFDEDGSLNGEFTGQPADMKKVNSLVLTMAKTVFGFSKEMSKDEKRAAKANAKSLIQSNEAIKAGLMKTAALSDEDE